MTTVLVLAGVLAIGLSGLGTPAARADTITLHWEGLPTGVVPNDNDLWFEHNTDPDDKKYAVAGVIDVSGTWGGSLWVPWTIETAGGRYFYDPEFSDIQPSTDNSFLGKSLFKSGDYGTTSNTELGDDGTSDYSLTIEYIERFKIIQHYQGIGATEPATVWVDEGTANYELSTSKLKEYPGGSGNYYICMGWTAGQGISPEGYDRSVTVASVSEQIEITWKYERAHVMTVGFLPASFTADANLLFQRTDGGRVETATLSGSKYYPQGEYTVSVDETVSVSPNRYLCEGYTNGVLSGAASAGPGTVDSGRVKVSFTHDRASSLDFIYRFQRSLTVAVDPALPANVRLAARPYPPEGANWFGNGESLTVHVEHDFIEPSSGSQWLCLGWHNGSGVVPATGTNYTMDVVLNQASAIEWRYGRVVNYTVLFDGLPSHLQGAGFSPPKGTSLMLLGDDVTLSAQLTIYDGSVTSAVTRYVCEGWTGTGDVTASGSDTSVSATVSQNSSVTWRYRKEYRLRVDVDPPGLATAAAPFPATGIHWYNDGVLVQATAGSVASNSTLLTIGTLGAAESGTPITQGTRRGIEFSMTGYAELTWRYRDSEEWVIGEPIIPPSGAASNDVPEIQIIVPGRPDDTPANSFTFGGPVGGKQLVPIRPVKSAIMTWNRAGGGEALAVGGYSIWPSSTQQHIGGVPVVVDPPSPDYSFYGVRFAESDGAAADKTFIATFSGRSVLQFVRGALPDPVNYASRFVVVNTVQWNDPAYLVTNRWTIGQAITNDYHDAGGLNGYVYFESAMYDADAYRRDLRTGPILPVNKDTIRDDDDMVVAWYCMGDSALGIYWPSLACHYTCEWPSDAEVAKIVIASQAGSGPLSKTIYPNGRLYVQPDPALPGHNPNEEHALLLSVGTDAYTVHALRNDLNTFMRASDPYVLFKYLPAAGKWSMRVFKVVAEDSTFRFEYPAVAGAPILPPQPISLLLPLMPQSSVASGEKWYHRDHKGGHWAKAASTTSGTARVAMRWYYPMQPSFDYPDYDNDGNPDAGTGEAVPFLNGGTDHDISLPTNIFYTVNWPANAADYITMSLGETLTKRKVDVFSMACAEVIHDENVSKGGGPLVKLIDPLTERWVPLAALPADIITTSDGPRKRFPDLPYYLKRRLSYDPLNKRLYFGGVLNESGVGDPLLLLNVMSRSERDALQNFNVGWAFEIGQLFAETRNPNGMEYGADPVVNPFNPALVHTASEWIALWGEVQLGLRRTDGGDVAADRVLGLPKALTAGAACGTGWVTLIENDDDSLGAAPVALHVIKVEGEPYVGEIKVIASDNVFDEKLTLRHSGDFGGEPDRMVFEWFYQPDTTGFAPPLPSDDPGDPPSEWFPFPGDGQEVTIAGASPLTLGDNWFMVRYNYANVFPFYTNIVHNSQKSQWAGQPGTDHMAQLAPGWIKRVVAGLNPFDARVNDFHAAPVNTTVSMIAQLGPPYEGPIAYNGNPQNLNSIGLIEAYETVLYSGMAFSINAGIDFGPANAALLNVATRLSDFYMLLGNEAYQDALDPTIGFGTSSGQYGTLAPSIFAFENQCSSLLGEELVLLRGRDGTLGPVGATPVYARLFWNFTQGEGEVAYVQAYNISDQVTEDTDNDGYPDDTDGVIDEDDAKLMYPQAHGDAWGHYLSAMGYHYLLLRHPNFTWEPRPEAVLVGGAPITVDYLDERKFARAGAAKARAGAEIVNLTYRTAYVDDPSGQWQGYKDTDRDRAWGFDGWARRAGQGAYFDWVVANAILPSEDPNTNHTGIAKVDRSTVIGLGDIASQYREIQAQTDRADKGLNPLGLAKGVVPFDIDPSLLSHINPKTHFEQVYDRAVEAMKNAVAVFDHANKLTEMLRRNEDTLEDFRQNVSEQERDYVNRLIEIFGYPYEEDKGANGSYPSGYDGPDWIHFMYVDPSELTGEPIEDVVGYTLEVDFSEADEDDWFGLSPAKRQITFNFTGDGQWMVKPPEWTSRRRAPGEIQRALSRLIQAKAKLRKGMQEYDNILTEIERKKERLETAYEAYLTEVEIKRTTNDEITTIEDEIVMHHLFELGLSRAADISDRIFDTLIESLPKSVGLSSDVSFAVRAVLHTSRTIAASLLNVGADAAKHAQMVFEMDKAAVERGAELQLLTDPPSLEQLQLYQAMLRDLDSAVVKRLEMSLLKEQIQQAVGDYLATVARGERLLSERAAWRKSVAPEIQEYRYQDMAFRVFRNDALQKYRAQFDLAARFVYLAATAYDYETNLLGGENGAGRAFLTDIVRQRCLGQTLNGTPMVGRPGLADPLARLGLNFAVYKSQMGFNNPQTETSRFSLRTEMFRIRPETVAPAGGSLTPEEIEANALSGEAWRNSLERARVADLWQISAFRAFCRPFAPEDAGAQPGLVIPFDTCVQFGQNFFGWPLSGGDSTYDPTHFATKIRTVGVWFSNYDGQGLSYTPRIYLVPVGADVMRSPSGDTLATREWRIVDQKIPVPFPIGTAELEDPGWIPLNDSLSDVFDGIRRFSRFRAYHDSGYFEPAETISDSRLIGRSVWNTRWLLIIPGETLLNPAAEGLDTFIYGQPIPGGGERDLNGVKDIKLFFQTYAYSGN